MRRGSSAEEAVEVAQVVAERRRRGGGGDRHDEGHPLARFPIAPARPQREARAEHDGGADEQAVEGDHRGSGLGTRDSGLAKSYVATLSRTIRVNRPGRYTMDT